MVCLLTEVTLYLFHPTQCVDVTQVVQTFNGNVASLNQAPLHEDVLWSDGPSHSEPPHRTEVNGRT